MKVFSRPVISPVQYDVAIAVRSTAVCTASTWCWLPCTSVRHSMLPNHGFNEAMVVCRLL